jgi:hypothetical protein
MAHDVFISHSVKDKVTADAVCAVLESEGVRCWIAPRDVMPGMEWGECIIEAIEQTRVMVLVFTADANSSPQIRREVERAVNHGVAILPVRIEDVMPGRALEYFIGNVHWLDALTPPLETHLKNLAGTVKMLLARLGQSPSPLPYAVAGGALQATKPPEAAAAPMAEPAFAPRFEPAAATRAWSAPAPPEERRPAEVSPAKAATEDTEMPGPAKVGPAPDSGPSDMPPAREFGGRIPANATARATPPRKIPVWAWGAGAVLALALIAVFAAVHFSSNPAPVASPEPVTSPAVAPNPASTPLPSGVPVGPASVLKTGPAKTTSPVTPGPSVSAKPTAPAPETAPENVPSLGDTMSTLQDELGSIGNVSFTDSAHNKTDGSSVQFTVLDQVSNVVADPAQCRVSWRWRVSQNGSLTQDINGGIRLQDVTSVVFEPMSQDLTEVNAAAGSPNWVVTSTTPPVTVLQVRGPGGAFNTFPFTDATLASRTAATLKQAVKLCGGHLAN